MLIFHLLNFFHKQRNKSTGLAEHNANEYLFKRRTRFCNKLLLPRPRNHALLWNAGGETTIRVACYLQALKSLLSFSGKQGHTMSF